jgi:hypothetical protein
LGDIKVDPSIVHSAWQIVEPNKELLVFTTKIRMGENQSRTCKSKTPVVLIEPSAHSIKGRKLPFIKNIVDVWNFDGHNLIQSVQLCGKMWQRALLKAAC